MPQTFREWGTRWGAEAALAVMATGVFLGFLGSADLWGKREQRASAEAVDTVERGHWLVAEIQSRPRLEKPPLPRWTIASLMRLTGRRDEWMVRLPGALSALGMVGLVYGLGRRLGGRSVGLASALALTSSLFFVSEVRQAGNDAPLAFFTTLAIYTAWRRLFGTPEGTAARLPAEIPGARGWAVAMWAALGLGFLTKGPIVVLLVAIALVPYLACARRLRAGLRALWDLRGIALFVALASSWPLPVVLTDSNAARVWLLEMGQKAGTAGIKHHRQRLLLADWPWMSAPWTLMATVALVWPFTRAARAERPNLWLPWWWTLGNLAMFCCWSVAKPNYFLPCLPGAALLTGWIWVRLCGVARGSDRASARARRFLQAHWIVFFVGAAVAPVVVGQLAPAMLAWFLVISAAILAAVIVSVWSWRRGDDVGALGSLVGALGCAVMVMYGAIAPHENATRSHRALAARLDQILPANARTIMFYRELDEGLWFYLHDRALRPVPHSQPKYNKDLDLLDEFQNNRLIWDDAERMRAERQVLIDWLREPRHESPYVLIRSKVYDRFAPGLGDLVTPIYAEHGLKRNELVLLRVNPAAAAPVATHPGSPVTPRR